MTLTLTPTAQHTDRDGHAPIDGLLPDTHRASIHASLAVGECIDTFGLSVGAAYSIRETCARLTAALVYSERTTGAESLAYAHTACQVGDLLHAQAHCARLTYAQEDGLMDLVYASVKATVAAYAAMGR
jgi:hypothetical protein